jgi:CBS-domain-containing membrane protein
MKRTEPSGVAPSFFRLLDSYLEEGGEETPGTAAPGQVDDIMTRDVVTATEDTPVHELARSMAERRIRRLIVTRDQRPIGLITVMAVLRTYPGATEPAAASRPAKAAPARRRPAPKVRKKTIARRR